MPKFIKVLFLILFLTTNSFSQSVKINELKSRLVNAKDTARVNTLNDLAKAHQFIDTKALLNYSVEARALAKKISYRNDEARAVCNIGAYFSRIGNHKESNKYIRLALSMADKNDYYLKMILLFNLGVHDSTSKKLTYLSEAMRLGKKIKFKQIGYFYSAIGKYYYNKSDFSTSYKYFIEGLKISQESNDSTTVALSLADISSILDGQNDDTSLKYCKDALQVAHSLHNKVLEAIIKEELVSYYRKKGDLDTALYLVQDVLKLGREVNYQRVIHDGLSEMGQIYQAKGNFKQSIKYYQEAMLVNSEDFGDMGAILVKLASVENSTHHPQRAHGYLKQAKAYLEQSKNLLRRSSLYLQLSETYAQTDNFAQAYYNFKKYHILQDSVYNADKTRQIASAFAMYEVDKREQAIKILSQQSDIKDLTISQSRILTGVMIGLCIAIFLIAILLYNLYTKKNKLSESLLKANQHVTQIANEKEVLLQEIHHRVKNNLQLISSLLKWQSEDIEDERLLKVISEGRSRIKSIALIHESLYQSNNLVYLNAGIYLDNLLSYLGTLYNKDKTVSIVKNITPLRVDLQHIIPLGLIVTELVSNSFKYAFPFHSEGTIDVSLHEHEEDNRTLIIKDNGIGIPNEFIDDQYTKTMGIQLVKTLVKQIKGNLKICGERGSYFAISFTQLKNTGTTLANYEAHKNINC